MSVGDKRPICLLILSQSDNCLWYVGMAPIYLGVNPQIAIKLDGMKLILKKLIQLLISVETKRNQNICWITCGVCVFLFILILNICVGPEEKFFWEPWGSEGTRLVSNLNIAQSSVECVDRIPKIATPAVHWLLLFQDTKTPHIQNIAHITLLWRDN